MKSKCKICRTVFEKRSLTHRTCPNVDCAIELMQRDKEKKSRKEARERKVAIRSRAQWMKLAQAKCNFFIRKRDGNLCISCGRHHEKQVHAGHYLSAGARPELRFEPDNIHSQCSACNLYKSGNITLYRINLIKKIGLERVEWLEGPHDPKKWTVEELQEIIRTYKAKAKELEA